MLDDLLEKKEQLELAILRQLVLAGGTASSHEIRKTVNLSKSAFDMYLEDISLIGQLMNKKVQIKKQDAQLVLELSEETSLEQILFFLLEQSIKFQLLLYLLEHQQVSIVQLSIAFSVSESSVFRKIKELNQLLAEFSLQIKNGQLYGEELQVRYFYYVFFQFFPEEKRPEYIKNTPEKRALIVGLERTLKTTFDSEALKKIACWVGITRKRLMSEKTTFSQVKEKKQLYQKDALYQALDSVVTLYYSRTAAEVNAYESLMFYSFFVSFSVLEEEVFYQYDLTRSKKLPTARLDTYIRETMLWHYRPRRLKIKEEKKIGYQLAQVNNELYFFQGILTIYDQDNLFGKVTEMLGKSLIQLLGILEKTVVEQLLETPPKKATLDYLMIQYANILLMIDYYIAKIITIGVDLQGLPIYKLAFHQFLIRELKGINGITIEKFQENKEYDLLITFNQERKQKHSYYLSEFASTYDILRLKQWIEQAKKAKN